MAIQNQSTCTPEYYESVRVAITKAWPHSDRVLFETPAKDLNDVDKNKKRLLGNSIGSKLKDLRRQLKKEQEPQQRAEPRTPLQLFWDHIHKAGDILANKNPFDDANVFKKIDQAFADIYDANENN